MERQSQFHWALRKLKEFGLKVCLQDSKYLIKAVDNDLINEFCKEPKEVINYAQQLFIKQ